MSEQHIQKLNLKALKVDTSTDEEVSTSKTIEGQDADSIPLEVIEKEDTWLAEWNNSWEVEAKHEWEVISEPIEKATITSSEMSSASIRKDVEETPIEIKDASIEVKKDITAENAETEETPIEIKDASIEVKKDITAENAETEETPILDITESTPDSEETTTSEMKPSAVEVKETPIEKVKIENIEAPSVGKSIGANPVAVETPERRVENIKKNEVEDTKIEKKDKWSVEWNNNWEFEAKQEWEVISEPIEKASITSAKMSFASIRKDVEETPIEIKDASIEVKKDITAENAETEETPILDITESTPEKRNENIKKNEVEETEKKDKWSVEWNNNWEVEAKQEWEKSPEEWEVILDPAEDENNKKGKKEWVFWFFKRKKEWVFWFFKRKKKKETDKENKTLTQEQEEEKKALEEVDFTNYESHFKKESSNFLSKFQKFKYTPKTRIWFTLSLICLTVFSIWALMIFLPNKHSPEIYKASIMQILTGKEKTLTVSPYTQKVLIGPTPKIINGVLTPKIINGGPTQEIINGGPTQEIINGGPTQEIINGVPMINKQEESKEKFRQYLLDRYYKWSFNTIKPTWSFNTINPTWSFNTINPTWSFNIRKPTWSSND
jgi:hypothetical protein